MADIRVGRLTVDGGQAARDVAALRGLIDSVGGAAESATPRLAGTSREFQSLARSAGVVADAGARVVRLFNETSAAVQKGAVSADNGARALAKLADTVGVTGDGLAKVVTAARASKAELDALEKGTKEYSEALTKHNQTVTDAVQKQQELAREREAAAAKEAEATEREIAAWDAAAREREANAAMIIADEKAMAEATKRRVDDEKAALQAMSAAWDAAAREREADAAMIIAAQKEEADAAEKTAARNKALADSHRQVLASIDPVLAAQQKYDKALADLRAGAAAAGMSADQLAAAEKRLEAAMSPAALAAKREEDSLRGLIGGLDRSFFAAERLTKGQEMLDRALHEGVGGVKLTVEQHAALNKVLRDQYELMTRTTTGTKLAAHEATNAAYQVQDFWVQVGSGQSVMVAFLQQAPQFVGSVGGMGRAVALLTSPTALAVAGVAAFVGVLALIGARAYQINSQIRELTVTTKAYGTEAQATAGQLRAMAQALYEGGASRNESYATAKVLAATRGISASLGREMAGLADDMSAGLGGAVDETVKKLTAMATEGFPAVAKLQEEIGFLSAAEMNSIRAMAEHGRQSDALAIALAALHRRFDGLRHEAMTPAEKAMHDLGVQFNRLVDAAANSKIIIDISLNISGGFKDLADFIESPSMEGLGRLVGRAVMSSPAAIGGNGRLGAEIGGKLFGANVGADAEASLRKKIAEAKARLADIETDTAQDPVMVRPEIDRARGDIEELERRLNEVLAKARAAAAASASSVAPAHRLANDLPDDAAQSSAQNQKAIDYVNEQAHAYDRLSKAMQGNAVQRAVAAAEMRAEDEIRDKHLEGTAAEELRTLRLKEAYLQLQVAVNDNNRVAMAEVVGNHLLAEAYGVSTAAVREAEIQAKALTEVARGSIEPYDAIVARLRAVDDAQRRVQAAQFGATLRQQAEDAQRLAAAWGKGANAAREAALANEVLAEARKRGLDPNRDAGEIQGIAGGVLARDAAQRAASFAQMAAEQRKAVDLANAEYGMLGASNAERAKAVAQIQAANDLAAKGANLADAGTQAYIAQAGELARVNNALQEAGQNAANIAQPIGSAFEDFLVGAEKAGDAVRALGEDLKRIVVRMTISKPFETAVTGMLTRVMSGGVHAVNDNIPSPANDPGALAKLVNTVQGGLGSSENSAMWVRLAGGAAALSVGGFAASMSQPLPVAVTDAGDITTQIRAAAREFGVPEDIALAVGRIESNLQQYNAQGRVLTSSAGAQGVMQLMPGTASWLGVDATNTQENIRGGVKFLAMLGRQFGGDWNTAVAAYNAGPGTVQAWQRGERSLPAETVSYLQKLGPASEAARQQISQAATSTQQFSGVVTQAGSRFAVIEQTAAGVTAAMEAQVAAQMDAASATNAGAGATQRLTAAQEATVLSALGLTKSQRSAATAAGQFTAQQEDTIAAALRQVESMDAVTGAAEDFDKRFGAASDGARTATESFARAQSQAANATVNAASVMAQASQQAGLTMVSGTQQAMGSLLSIIGSASGVKGGGIPGQVIQAGGPQGLANSFSQLSGALGLNSAGDAFGGIKDFLNTPIFGSPSGVATGYVDTIGATQITNTPGMTGNGATWGDAIGAVGYGFNAFQNFSQGNVVGGIGNTAATVMSFIPGLQPFAPLVAIGSSLLGSLFGGGDKQYPLSWYDATGGQTRGAYSLDGGDTSQLRQAGDQVQTALRQMATSLNVPVASLPTGGFTSNPDGHPGVAAPKGYSWFSYAEGQGGWESAKSADSLEKAVAGYVLATLKGADLSGVEPLVKKALNSGIEDTDRLSSALSLAKQVADATAGLDSLDTSLAGLTSSTKKAAAAQYESAKEAATLADEAGIGTEYRTLLERQIRASWQTAAQAVTPLQAALAGIDGNFAALTDGIKSLGLSIGAAEVEAARLAQREKVLADYRKSYDTALHQAQGRDYLTQVQGVRDYWTANAADMLSAGRNPNDLYAAQLSSAINGLDVKALDDIIAFFKELDPVAASFAETRKGQLQAVEEVQKATERGALSLRLLEAQVGAGQATQAAYDAAKRRADRDAELAAATDATKDMLAQVYAAQDLATASEAAKKALEAEWQVRADAASLLERAYKAVGRDYRATMVSLDQQQQTELRTAMAGGTTDIGLLLRTQAVERAQAGLSAVSGLIDKQIAARNAEVAAIRETVESTKALQRGLLETADALAIDSSTSPLAPQEILAEAQRQWTEAVGKARAGDTDAMGRLSDLGRSYIEADRAYNASASRTAYDAVQSVLRDLGTNGTATLDAQQALVTAADDQVKQLTALKQTADAALAAQQAVPVSIADLTVAVSGGIDKLIAANDNLASIMAGKTAPSGDSTALMQAIFGSDPGNAGYGAPAGLQYTDGQGRAMSAGRFYSLAFGAGYQGDYGHGEIGAKMAEDADFRNRLNQALDLYWQAQASGLIGKIPGYVDGGVVGNGLWGKDSVVARYAGGGAIALAGGEFVMPAAETAAYRPVLDAMRAGTWEPANAYWRPATNSNHSSPSVVLPSPPRVEKGSGDGSATVVAEIRRTREDVTREIRQQTSTTVEMMQRQIDAQAAEIAELRRRIDKQSSEIRLSNDRPNTAKTKAKGAA